MNRPIDHPRRASAIALAAALATFAGAVAAQGSQPARPAPITGYATSTQGNVVISQFGSCVRTGQWTPADAAEPCDRVARADLAPVPVAAVPAPQPEPAPAPQAQAAPAPVPLAAPEPPRPVIQKLTLSTDVLFDFGKSELKDSGKARLDQLASEIKGADVDEIVAVGHADRIASEDYNQKLSEARAQAVKDYLAQQGAKSNVITAQGKGESQPVTGEDCKKLGAERGSNKKLVACLQPDRRGEIEALGSREVPAGSGPAAGGASSPGTTDREGRGARGGRRRAGARASARRHRRRPAATRPSPGRGAARSGAHPRRGPGSSATFLRAIHPGWPPRGGGAGQGGTRTGRPARRVRS